MSVIRGTLFTEVYKSFLSKITEDMYMELTEEDTYEILRQLLLSSIHSFEFPRQSLKYQLIKIETETGTFLLKWTFINKLTEQEINILSNYMVVQWIGQQLASVQNTRMKYSGADFKFTSQANHIHKLLQLKREYEQKGFHLQRLYKRRKVDQNGIYRSTFANLMDKPVYKDTNSIDGNVFIRQDINTKNFVLTKGDTFSFDLIFSDLQGIEITSIIFSVKMNKNNVQYVFQKALEDGIYLVDPLRYRIRINSQDTENLIQGKYYYDLEVKLGEDTYTVMAGVLVLEEDITKG